MGETTATTVFTMPSGVECEVREMTGKEQRLLTEQDGKKFAAKLNDVLRNIIVRVGNKTHLTDEDITTLLSEDRKCILWNARMFSVGEDKFTFEYKYIDKDRKEQVLPLEVDLNDEQPDKPYKKQWSSLETIEKKVLITLPRCGKKVQFTMLDGLGEGVGASTKKSELSSHTPIYMRCPVEFMPTQDGKTETPLKLNLDKLSLVDIEFLRSSIAEHEGKFHTELRFEHPEAELKGPSEKFVVTDLLGEMAFFFPSGRI